MFVVVRNVKSQQKNVQDYVLQKGDTIKLGRLKFAVKDFRTDDVPANMDLRTGNCRNEDSPVKSSLQKYIKSNNSFEGSKAGREDDSDDELQEEEAVEIDCGVVNANTSGGVEIQCKVCWSSE